MLEDEDGELADGVADAGAGDEVGACVGDVAGAVPISVAGFAGLVVELVLTDGDMVEVLDVLLEGALDAAALLDGALASTPPAACSNALRCVRNSTSFARMAGSICTAPLVAAPPVPVALLAPLPPVAVGVLPAAGVLPVVPVVPAVEVAPVAAVLSAAFPPSSVLRFASTFAYDAFQSLCVVMSSLKLAISCEICVRASPCRRAASGSDVNWLSESRASLRACLAAVASTCADACGCAPVGDCADGSWVLELPLGSPLAAGWVLALGVGDVALGVGVAALDDADDWDPIASGLVALDAADASGVLADGLAVPLIEAASSVMWRRTICSCAFAFSSSVVAWAEAARPLVPVGVGSLGVAELAEPLADPALSGPIMSVRILSMAATSVAQFAAPALAAGAFALVLFAADALPPETARSRVFKWVFSCANLVLSAAGIEV